MSATVDPWFFSRVGDGESRVQVSPGWLLVAIFIIGVNLAAIRVALVPKREWIPGTRAGVRSILVRQMYDGSVVKYYIPSPTGGLGQPVVVRPPSAIGLWRVWWPVAASVGISVIILGIARIVTGRRPAKAMRRPRAKTIEVMLVIGLISFGFWLIRFDPIWMISGSLVLLLMLLAAYRRAALGREIEITGRRATALSLAAIAGYSIAVLLALAWITCILFWDSFQSVAPEPGTFTGGDAQ